MAAKPAWLLVAAGASLCVSAIAAALPQAAPGFGVRRGDARPLQPIQYRRNREAMSPDEVVATLAARGYRAASPPRRKGDNYVVEAIARRGERATIVVDIWSGEISGLRRRRAD
jgi:hypothetical protein